MKLKHEVIRTRFPRIRVLKGRAKKYQVDARPLAPRKSFATKVEANTYAVSIAISKTNQGTESMTTLTTDERMQALRAFKLLNPHGRTLADAVDFYVAHIEQQRKRHESLTVDACLDEYLAQLKGDLERGALADTSFRSSKMYVGIFRAAFGALHITDITERVVRDYLDGLKMGQRSRVNYRAALSRFLSWGISHDHLEKNACSRIKLKVESHDVVILTVDQAKALLGAAMNTPLRGYFSVACFAGLRPSEIQRLDWKDVHLATTKHITVWRHKTKVKETRHVPIHPTLAQWLEPIAKQSGSVTPRNWRAQFRAVLKAAGFTKARPYVQDSCRHSFASYTLSLTKNRGALAEVMGNSVRTIRTSYRAPVMETDAYAFFALTPEAVSKGQG